MPPARRPRTAAAKPPAAATEPTTTTPETVELPSGLDSAARVDAILRDPQCPPDVRATVAALHATSTYLDSVDFVTGDDGYVTVTHPDPAPAPGDA